MSTTAISAGGIVVFKEHNHFKILLVTTSNGLLAFPKGHVEGIETFEQTAIREMQEEIGLQRCFINEFLGTIVRIGTEHDGSHKEKHIHIFSMSGSGFSHVHEENFVWIDLQKAISLMKYKEEAKFLIQHLEKIQSNAVSVTSLNLPYYGSSLESNYNPNDIFKETIDTYNLSIISGKDQILAYCPTFNSTSNIPGLLQISEFADNLIMNDLPNNLEYFFGYNSMELSNTKLFFTLNTIIKKMNIGGYIIIASDSFIEDSNTEEIGGGLIRKNGQIKQSWDINTITTITEKLQLERISLGKELNNKPLRYIILQKKVDYAY